MKLWGAGFWAGLLGVSLYGEIKKEQIERGEQLAKHLILAAAGADRQLFDNLLRCNVGVDIEQGEPKDSLWNWSRQVAREIEEYRCGHGKDMAQFVNYKRWCVEVVKFRETNQA